MSLVSKNQANTIGIFKHLCDQMDKLSVKAITVDEAKAQANLAKQANNILKYELERAKVLGKYDKQLRRIES